jgi:hypothetical protein
MQVKEDINKLMDATRQIIIILIDATINDYINN